MKKIFICTALFCALCSCTSESYIDTEIIEENAECNVGYFEKDSEDDSNTSFVDESEQNLYMFELAVRDIIKVHKDFPWFREILSADLLEKMDSGKFSLDDGVKIILVWYSDWDCYDILIEWPAFDDFRDYMPEKYKGLFK